MKETFIDPPTTHRCRAPPKGLIWGRHPYAGGGPFTTITVPAAFAV
ncbi:MAG TPA: hypothetical protein K8V84_14545 [Nocardiopsis listeri]|nr:hypothetical protein [Nocardiopsis listeri]HJE59706.1 hypothetical protein [Nocardiopsis listeri]